LYDDVRPEFWVRLSMILPLQNRFVILYMSLTVYKREAMLWDRIDRRPNPIIVQKLKLCCLFTVSLLVMSDPTSGFSQGGAWQIRSKIVSVWKYHLIPYKYFKCIFYETLVYSYIHYATYHIQVMLYQICYCLSKPIQHSFSQDQARWGCFASLKSMPRVTFHTASPVSLIVADDHYIHRVGLSLGDIFST